MASPSQHDRFFMKQALRLALKGLGRTSPNPMVGAVVVKNGLVVGQGYHQRAGGPHAEQAALAQAGARAEGATLYLNLEPCHHQGRTPPCTKAILAGRIKKVVFGMVDPNPRVQGGGARYLQSQGIEVIAGVLEADCRRLNEVFIKWITQELPFVILKAAVSLDGRIATRTGDSKWISNEHSRLYVHRLRNQVDGVLVGIGTVLKDDPLLTVRLPRGKVKDPVRIVIDPGLQFPVKARMFSEPGKILIITGERPLGRKIKELRSRGAEVLFWPTQEGRFSTRRITAWLGRQGITSLLVEGGAEIYGSFLFERQVDKLVLFFAPLLIGGRRAKAMIGGVGLPTVAEAIRLKEMKVKRLGGDILVEAYPEK